jgi:N-acetylmuramoyl-L-alanine amidase
MDRALVLLLVCIVACSVEPEALEYARSPSLLDQAAHLLRESRRQNDPVTSARLQFDAAQLTEAAYRKGGEPSEARAAVLLYQALALGPLGCRGELRAAALQSELDGDAAGVRLVATRLRSGGCGAEAGRVLVTVGDEAQPANATTPQVVTMPVVLDPTTFTNDAVQVTEIQRYGALDSARIVVFLSSPAQYQAGALPPEPTRGPRFFVDLPGTSYEGERSFEVGGVVQRVRVGEGEEGVRVVLDLRERVYQRVFFLPEPFRVVIDVSSEAPRLHPKTGQRQVSRVVLDPGHGGHDPGAIGATGLEEKDVALDLALRAGPLIARELGIDTLLTRESDEFIPLHERVAKANAFSADLFISLHCNASESSASHGVMTFVLDESRDSVADRIAARENAASAAASQQFASLLTQVMDAESVARSSHFAELLQRTSMASLQPSFGAVVDGGVRRAGFFVLAGAEMPAVLYEASFISNGLEEQRLDTASYRQKLADAIVNAVRAYRDGL